MDPIAFNRLNAIDGVTAVQAWSSCSRSRSSGFQPGLARGDRRDRQASADLLEGQLVVVLHPEDLAVAGREPRVAAWSIVTVSCR